MAWSDGEHTAAFAHDGTRVMCPSAVALRADGTIDPDPAALATAPGRIRVAKRHLLEAAAAGTQPDSQILAAAAARVRYLYDAFATTSPVAVQKAVLTCPASAGLAYRRLLEQIGERAGLPAVEIVDEPTAAAVHHGAAVGGGARQRWIVVDWGAGTLDLTAVERLRPTAGDDPAAFDLNAKAIDNDDTVGGLDMDAAIADALATAQGLDRATVDPDLVEALKIELVRKDRATGPIVPGGPAVELGRAAMETAIAPLLDQASNAIARLFEKAGWVPGSQDVTIVTGGPTQMPAVVAAIAAACDCEPEDLLADDPMTSVALGAARLAERKRVGGGAVRNLVTKPVGVRIARPGGGHDTFHVIVDRDEDTPVSRTVELTTSVDLQDRVDIEIREGFSADPEANTLLGRIQLTVRPEVAGAIRIPLTVHLAGAGSLSAYVSADGAEIRGISHDGVDPLAPAPVAGLALGSAVDELERLLLEDGHDPAAVRLHYRRLRLKYHPDRDPRQTDRLKAELDRLDKRFEEYERETERQMRAATAPELPWGDPAALGLVTVDARLALHLVRFAAAHPTDPRAAEALRLSRRYIDFRRVAAGVLADAGTTPVLQAFLADGDRPHVAAAVLLQALPGKTIIERHTVLKALYRTDEETVRAFLRADPLDTAGLYNGLRDNPPAAVFGGAAPATRNGAAGRAGAPTTAGGIPTDVVFEYDAESDTTYVTGNTYPVKDTVKSAGFRWDGKRKAWYAKGRHAAAEVFRGDG